MLKVIPLQKLPTKLPSEADILEIWFDRISAKHHEKILEKAKKTSTPIIYKLEKKLTPAKVLAVQYIDVDVSTAPRTIKQFKKLNPKIKVIISYHNFKETPYGKDLKGIHKKMSKKGADIVKFATHAKSITDSFRMLDFLSELSKKGQKAICLCMGKHGLLTRISGHLFGNYLMYFSASKSKESKTAPGQITIKEFNEYTHES
jgi:3-dehydroquinate dehydratase I